VDQFPLFLPDLLDFAALPTKSPLMENNIRTPVSQFQTTIAEHHHPLSFVCPFEASVEFDELLHILFFLEAEESEVILCIFLICKFIDV
jgi:hypothetical protein